MAQQKGVLSLKGSIGNITFIETKHGFKAREKKSLDAGRIAKDPAFARTRENGAEFGRACKAGKLLRESLRAVLKGTADKEVIGRLVKAMMAVIRNDEVSERGLRNVIDGGAGLLEGFEFNSKSTLSSVLHAPFTSSIDRANGTISVNIPSFFPAEMLVAAPGATHFRIISAGAEIDFENGKHVEQQSSTAELPLDSNATGAIVLSNSVTANSPHPLFFVLGIQFYQKAGGKMYPFNNGAFNALSLVKVSGESSQ
jgi:hypothetical protein